MTRRSASSSRARPCGTSSSVFARGSLERLPTAMTAWGRPRHPREKDAAASGLAAARLAFPNLCSAAIDWVGLVTRQDWSAHRADERSVERLPRGRRLRPGARLRQHLPRRDVEPGVPAGLRAGAPPAGVDLRALLRRRRRARRSRSRPDARSPPSAASRSRSRSRRTTSTSSHARPGAHPAAARATATPCTR